MTELGIFWVVIGLPVLYLVLGAAATHHVASGKRVFPKLPKVPDSDLKKTESKHE